jgi:hypothetical protein
VAGEPSYIELGVTNPDKARAFYGGVLGWDNKGETGPGQIDLPGTSIGIHGGDDRSLFELGGEVTA